MCAVYDTTGGTDLVTDSGSTTGGEAIAEFTSVFGDSYEVYGGGLLTTIYYVSDPFLVWWYDPYDFSYYENNGETDTPYNPITWMNELAPVYIAIDLISMPQINITLALTTTYGANTLGSQIIRTRISAATPLACSSGVLTCGSPSWTVQNASTEPCSYYIRNSWVAVKSNGTLAGCYGISLPAAGPGPCSLITLRPWNNGGGLAARSGGPRFDSRPLAPFRGMGLCEVPQWDRAAPKRTRTPPPQLGSILSRHNASCVGCED